MKFDIKNNFLTEEQFKDIKNLFNEQQIIEYCNDETVLEHDASLHGNYSFPAELAVGANEKIFSFFDNKFFEDTTEQLLGNKLKHRFSYANFHYDMPQSYLGIHNDLKDYRWLITAQLYIDGNKNDGVVLYDQKTKKEKQVLCLPNTFYCLFADPFSWHYVNPLTDKKKSLLIRWGQKKINTVVNKNTKNDTAILIIGDFHHNDDDIKIGHRLQNLTEAWLLNQGYSNIYNTRWKDSKSYAAILFYLLKHYEKICLVPAGYFGEGNLYEKPCVFVTTEFVEYKQLIRRVLDISSPDIFKAEKTKMKSIKETIFEKPKIEILAQAEKILYNTDILNNFSYFEFEKIT